MERRIGGALIGILALVCVGLVLAAVVPFTTADPHASNPPQERFTVGDHDAYSVSGRILVDGDVRLAFEGIVTADGGWYQRVIESTVTTAQYHPAGTDTVYQRFQTADRATAQRIRDQVMADADRTLLRTDQDGDRVTYVVEATPADATAPVSGTVAVVVDSLSVVQYERNGTDGSAVTVFEPQSGWYDGREPYRITEASGTVRADAETRVVNSAHVSWDVTTPAGTYAEALLVRATSDDPTRQTITYAFDPGEQDLPQPPWVDRAESA